MAIINQNLDSIVFQATTKMLELVTEAVTTRNKKRRKDAYAKAAKIRYLLKSVAHYPTYIDAEQANQILQCLIVTSGIQDYPTPPALDTPSSPASGVLAIKGDQGDQGIPGQDGGGTDFSAINVNSNTTVDSFSVSSAYAARWDYVVNGTAQRAGTIWATWTEDGLAVDYTEAGTADINGVTIGLVTFSVVYSSGTIKLNVAITGGLWDIRGTRYFIPNQGVGVVVDNTALPDGQIFIGNSSNVPAANAVTGDVTITNAGVTNITAGVVVNADINASAAIAVSKLAALPNNSSVVLSDGSGKLTSIANGSEAKVLTITSGVPAWTSLPGGGSVTSVAF